VAAVNNSSAGEQFFGVGRTAFHWGFGTAYSNLIMINAGQNLAKCRAIITSACNMLLNVRHLPGNGARELPFSNADSYVLLQDATKLFCQYVSEFYGEPVTTRWSPSLPELLLAHPERCQEALELLEKKDFKTLSYLQFVAA